MAYSAACMMRGCASAQRQAAVVVSHHVAAWLQVRYRARALARPAGRGCARGRGEHGRRRRRGRRPAPLPARAQRRLLPRAQVRCWLLHAGATAASEAYTSHVCNTPVRGAVIALLYHTPSWSHRSVPWWRREQRRQSPAGNASRGLSTSPRLAWLSSARVGGRCFAAAPFSLATYDRVVQYARAAAGPPASSSPAHNPPPPAAGSVSVAAQSARCGASARVPTSEWQLWAVRQGCGRTALGPPDPGSKLEREARGGAAAQALPAPALHVHLHVHDHRHSDARRDSGGSAASRERRQRRGADRRSTSPRPAVPGSPERQRGRAQRSHAGRAASASASPERCGDKGGQRGDQPRRRRRGWRSRSRSPAGGDARAVGGGGGERGAGGAARACRAAAGAGEGSGESLLASLRARALQALAAQRRQRT